MANHQLEKLFDSEKKLTKEQSLFKKRVEDIKKLQEELELLTDSIPKAFAQFQAKTSSIRSDIHQVLIKRVEALDEALWQQKLSKKLKSELADIIINECYSILNINPDQKVTEIMERAQSGKPEKEKQMEQDIHQAFNNMFSGFEGPNDGLEQEENPSKNKKAQAKFQAKQEAKKRSVKDIYKELIKRCHPDKELDESQKKAKEELSKEITVAYKNNDLLKLLEFELKLIDINSNRVNEMAKEKLMTYNEVLLEQKQKLEMGLFRLKHENELIYRGMCMKNSKPEKFIKMTVAELQEEKEKLQYHVTMISQDKNFLKQFISSYMQQIEDEFYFDFE